MYNPNQVNHLLGRHNKRKHHDRNGQFIVRTMQTITGQVQIAHRVYTGNVGMAGKMNVSRSYKALVPKNTVRNEVVEYPLTSEAAKMIVAMMEARQLSKLDNDNWAVYNMAIA